MKKFNTKKRHSVCVSCCLDSRLKMETLSFCQPSLFQRYSLLLASPCFQLQLLPFSYFLYLGHDGNPRKTPRNYFLFPKNYFARKHSLACDADYFPFLVINPMMVIAEKEKNFKTKRRGDSEAIWATTNIWRDCSFIFEMAISIFMRRLTRSLISH